MILRSTELQTTDCWSRISVQYRNTSSSDEARLYPCSHILRSGAWSSFATSFTMRAGNLR